MTSPTLIAGAAMRFASTRRPLEGDRDPIWAELGGDAAAAATAGRYFSARRDRVVAAAGRSTLDPVDGWAMRTLASMPDGVFSVVAVAGEVTPAWLARLDRERLETDRMVTHELSALIEVGLADALRRAGLAVMAAVRDPEVEDILRVVPIEDVPRVSRTIEIRPGRTLRAALTTKEEEALERAIDDLLRKARRILDRSDRRAFKALSSAIGVKVAADDREDRVEAALRVLETEFRRLVDETVEPARQASDSEEEGESIDPGSAPPLIVFKVAAALGGGAVSGSDVDLDSSGVPIPADGSPVSGSGAASGPAVTSALRRELAVIGSNTREAIAERAAIRAELAAALDAASDELDRIRETLIAVDARRVELIADIRDARSALDRVVRSEREIAERARRAEIDRLTDELTEARAEKERLLRAQKDARTKVGSARDKARAETLRASGIRGAHPAGVVDAARLIDAGRFEMRHERVWRRGSPSIPFPPHEDLDGVLDGDADAFSKPHVYKLKDGTERTVAPFGGGRWRPGDHKGCQCYWESTTVLFLNVDIPEPPGLDG